MHLECYKILKLVKVIDLSRNKLKGEIPREITSLLGWIGLNLSRNLLTSVIPRSIGHLEKLDSLDLSSNYLLGVIPSTLATLSYLNLSNNNLSSRVPTGTQFKGFHASIYAANWDLCGLPLGKKCLGDAATQGPQIGRTYGEGNIQENANSHEHLWFFYKLCNWIHCWIWGSLWIVNAQEFFWGMPIFSFWTEWEIDSTLQ